MKKNHPKFTKALNEYSKSITKTRDFEYDPERLLPHEWFSKEMEWLNNEIRQGHFIHGSKEHGKLLQNIANYSKSNEKKIKRLDFKTKIAKYKSNIVFWGTILTFPMTITLWLKEFI